MRTISFRDLMVCEELAHIKNEIELLHTDNDSLMESILSKVGFDCDYPIAYIPSKHRCMQNKVAVGYCVVGDISINREFINSPMCSITERMVAASYSDPSLTREMGNLMGNHINYKSLLDDSIEDDGEELSPDMIEEDYEFVQQQIKQLEEIRDHVRGSMYNEAGDVKCFSEYKIKSQK